MALTASILMIYVCTSFMMIEASSSHYSNDRGLEDHKFVWPFWYQKNLLRVRHNQSAHGAQTYQETSTRSSWIRDDLTERSTLIPRAGSVNRGSRHHEYRNVEQRSVTQRPEKFSAVAVADYDGTRAIAYAGYHSNHRHQPRETVTQSCEHAPTTVATYTRHHPGRRVCSRQIPSSTTHHHRGRQIRYIYTELSSGFLCCPGWAQVTHLSFGCNRPICSAPCLNGGICASPGKCTCPKGFTGSQCQTDVDECVTEKPCDQLCRNLPGIYECHCRPGFHLQKDGQSCRKNDSDGTAFEARDLENNFNEMSTTTTTTKRPSTSPHDTENEVADSDLDQDYEIILKRLTKLEKIAKGKKRDTDTSEMTAKIASAVESINKMKTAVESVQHMQQAMYDIRNKLKEYESDTRTIQHLKNRVANIENRLRLHYQADNIDK